MRIRHTLPVLLLMPILTGCATPGGKAVPTESAYPIERATGVILCADGAGGPGGTSSTLQDVVTTTNTPIRVEMVDWSHGPLRYLADHVRWSNIEQSGQTLAQHTRELRRRHPDKKIHFIGQSAGCGVVLVAAEQLPPNSIDKIVLLAPSVSSRYDLRPAMRAARDGIVVFYSRKDWFVCGVGAITTGTTDRRLLPSSGRVGFEKIVTTPGDESLYAHRLRQYGWNPSVSWTGNDGRHFGAKSPGHLKAYVLPLLVGSRSRD